MTISHARPDNTLTQVPILQTLTEEVFFPRGLVGFHEYQNFYLHHYGEDSYLLLESKDDPEIRFLLCSLSWDFYPTKDLVDGLIAENLDEIDEHIYAIVCCTADAPTLNLRAPLVREDNKMWQIVLHSGYPLDYPME